ncbi:MAG: dienelactone hydrolase family protein [Deltaproteobacteria bacterium]
MDDSGFCALATLLTLPLLGACSSTLAGEGGAVNEDYASKTGASDPRVDRAADPDPPAPGGSQPASAPSPGSERDGRAPAPAQNDTPANQDPGASLAAALDCTSLPAASDYGAPGPFADARMFSNVGPSNDFTLFRPGASLGTGGLRHPIATWGNGISTTPDQYQKTLSLIASHGFVIIACNDTQAERPCLSAGLDWLVEQNDTAGELQGKLDITREVTIGYSWGGGAAIDTADRPNVKATVSLHGMPPRGAAAFADMHAPLLLFTSTGDSFVTAQQYVTPNFQSSQVQTFYGTLADSGAGHLYVVDEGAAVCVGAILGLGACRTALAEQAPTIAWLRYWACADESARRYFFGADCTLCSAPWAAPQRKQFP